MIRKELALLISLYFALYPGQVLGGPPKYVGSRGCSCHKVQLTDWELSVHGRAFDTLKAGRKENEKMKAGLDPQKNYTEERKCLKCHTTGYRQNGGFMDIKSTPSMIGAGCESCHGPGSEYRTLHENSPAQIDRNQAKAFGAVYGSEDVKVCTACHNKNSGHFNKKSGGKYSFDWQKALKNRRSYHREQVFNKPNFF